jgi:hypothetical protein
MPVEIKELVIQAKAQSAGNGQNKTAAEANDKEKVASSASGVVGRITHDLRRQIVEDCVAEVLEKLEKNRMI